MVTTKTTRRLKATSRRARPRWRSHQRRARRCRLQRRRLAPTTAYGWLAGKRGMAGQPACRIYPERGWGPWQEALRRGSRGRKGPKGPGPLSTGFYFQKFFPKKFAKKFGRGPQNRNFGKG